MDPCNPSYPLLTTEQAKEALEHKFPDAGVPLEIHPGMEPTISWLVAHENMLREAGLFPGCIPGMEPLPDDGSNPPSGEDDDETERGDTPSLETEEQPSVEVSSASPVVDSHTLTLQWLREILSSPALGAEILALDSRLVKSGLNARKVNQVAAAILQQIEGLFSAI